MTGVMDSVPPPTEIARCLGRVGGGNSSEICGRIPVAEGKVMCKDHLGTPRKVLS